MPSLQIRDLPAAVHRLLVERARQERCTIAQQATTLPAEALVVSPLRERRRAVLAELSRKRKPFDFTKVTLPEDLIRVDRNR